MTFWFLLAGVISIIIAIPYFRFVFKRIKCACLIKKVCKKRKFRSFAVKPLWFFGCKYGKNCDVYIETPNEVYSVKLFGMKKRRSVLLLWEDGRYSVRNFIAVISFGTAIQYPIDSKAKDMSVFDSVVKGLATIGYVHEGDLGIKGREAFDYKDKPHLKKHHLYVCPQYSEELHRHVAFRELLRSDHDAAERYGKVKQEAAKLFPCDIEKYINYKSQCIKELYERCGLKKD